MRPKSRLYSSFEPRANDHAAERGRAIEYFSPTGQMAGEGVHVFRLDAAPQWCGQLALRVRILPYHALLTHPYEMGLMKWV